MSFLRSRLLGGAAFMPLFAPEDGSGAGAGGGGAAAGAGAGGTAAGTAAAAGNGAGGAAGGTAGTGAGAAAAGGADAAAAAAAAGAGKAGSQSLAGGADAGAAAGAGTGADASKAGQQQQVAQWLGTAPPDWREQLAGDDKGFLNQLKRHTTPQSAFDWLRKTSLKLSAGELKEIKAAPGADATDEEKAAWRKDQGLPEKPEGYVASLKLPDGMVMGEADKPLLNSLAARAHERGVAPQAFNEMVSWYYETQVQQAQAREQADNDARVEAQQRLVSEMGPDFKPNMNVLKSFWNEYGAGEVAGPNGKSTIADTMLTARTGDGRILGDIPEVAQFIAKLGRELNPAATILPLGGSQDIKGVQARKSEIEKTMYVNGKQNPAYFGNDSLQKEYRDLIEAEQKMSARAG